MRLQHLTSAEIVWVNNPENDLITYFSMASQPKQNHLLIIEDDQGRKQFILDRPTYSIGRDPQCDIRLFSQFVSRRHATLIRQPREDGSFYYQINDGDLKGKPSANGMLINGRKSPTHKLKNADEVVFGPQVRAIYYLLQRDTMPSGPLDEYDVTLIGPNMMPDFEE